MYQLSNKPYSLKFPKQVHTHVHVYTQRSQCLHIPVEALLYQVMIQALDWWAHYPPLSLQMTAEHRAQAGFEAVEEWVLMNNSTAHTRHS